MPAENQQNVEEDLTPEQQQGLNIHYVKTIDELLSIALPTSRDEVKQDAEVREQVLQELSLLDNRTQQWRQRAITRWPFLLARSA